MSERPMTDKERAFYATFKEQPNPNVDRIGRFNIRHAPTHESAGIEFGVVTIARVKGKTRDGRTRAAKRWLMEVCNETLTILEEPDHAD